MTTRFFDSQLERFIRSLDESTIAKVLRTIDLLEEFGHKLGLPHSKQVDVRLYELRVRGKQEVRIFYAFHKNEVFLLHAFVKKSQRIPKRNSQQQSGNLKRLTQYNIYVILATL